MNNYQNLVISDFLLKEKERLYRLEEEIRIAPMVYEQRIDTLEQLLKRGIHYGLERGMSIQQRQINVVRKAKDNVIEKYVDELMMNINIRNAQHMNLPRIKYSKRKYRLRRKNGGEQLVIKFDY